MNVTLTHLGHDIDDNLGDMMNSIHRVHFGRYGIPCLPYEACIDYDIQNVLGCATRDEAIARLHNILGSEIVDDKELGSYNATQEFRIHPFPQAREALTALGTRYTQSLVTARNLKICYTNTLKWAQVQFPEVQFEGIHFSYNVHARESGKPKWEICREQGIQLMTEDSWENALQMAEHGICVFLQERPWNKDKVHHPRVTYIRGGWDEITQRLMKDPPQLA